MRIDVITGARPNMMKVAPLYHALKAAGRYSVRLIHTGQHYDDNLSRTFFSDFALPAPDIFLDVRSGTHAVQTARVMEGYEKICLDAPPELTIVVGDVNSTVACALVAKKCNLPLAHLEAGLRSGDRSMPEEINRIVTDAISDLLWTHSEDADANLFREGHQARQVKRVGNIMIDAYELVADRIHNANKPAELGVQGRPYIVLTLHRPANVDDPHTLATFVEQIASCSALAPIVFPVHPRTRRRLDDHGLWRKLAAGGQVITTDPLGYIDFMSLVTACSLAITDSGGLQEETSYLGIPCITVRESTERPVTVTLGTNILVSLPRLFEVASSRLAAPRPPRPQIPLWDGRTSERILQSLAESFPERH